MPDDTPTPNAHHTDCKKHQENAEIKGATVNKLEMLDVWNRVMGENAPIVLKKAKQLKLSMWPFFGSIMLPSIPFIWNATHHINPIPIEMRIGPRTGN